MGSVQEGQISAPRGEHLAPVGDEPWVLADRRAAGAAELDVRFAAVAVVGSEFESHEASVG